MRISFDTSLPICEKREEIVAAIGRGQVTVISGETGSGKTTQIPKMCLQAGLTERGVIACTQPRRVAATSISKRIAEELDVRWGAEVGAKIRFTDKTSRDTLIKVMTDGMLLSEIQSDPDLRQYSTVIVDEAHERSLNIDFLLGYLKLLLKRRSDLKVIITSATIDTKRFSEAFDNAEIIEVSGRLYPVETIYYPLDEHLEQTGELTYIEAAVRAIEEIIAWNREGDVLVFFPSEKDIRETKDILDGNFGNRLNVLPLFGRLSGADQERIFHRSRQRKVVLSTNIAETSITIPGIRYVVDTGLARISRYSAHTHTRRLPIEKIPRSSADQRKGRAGRLSDGVCIRLYSEDDYNSRDKFATPEILRSNLADVILRMIAFKIGEVRTFPFVEPPSERAIKAGFQQLIELGAIHQGGELTKIGSQLARLPVDPSVGRMLLEASKEGALREVLIIASGLSIQDPRERPMDAIDAADRSHARFKNSQSDFLSLVAIWDAFHEQMEQLSQKRLRKFCRDHFLSYLRMREWRDIHQQLERVLKDMRQFRYNSDSAEYAQIHRSLLTGLISGVAQWDEGNFYKGLHNRKAMLFPASGLFRKSVARKQGKRDKNLAENKAKQKAVKWILTGEYVETSQVFARTVAEIDPAWVLKAAAHLLKRKYTEPLYQEKGERVVVKERVLLHGLEISSSFVGYSRINPEEATEIFIREALVAQRLISNPSFYTHNRQLFEELEERQTKIRSNSLWAVSENLYGFYKKRIEKVGSLADLNRFLKEKHGGKDAILHAEEDDLIEPPENSDWETYYPSQVELGGNRIPLGYAYKPGEDNDGATLKIPVETVENVDPALLDWVVPGYIGERIACILRGLPKKYRKELIPLSDLIEEVRLKANPKNGSLLEQIRSIVRTSRNLDLPEEVLSGDVVPEHLLPRFEVIDKKERVIASSRSWDTVERNYREATLKGLKEGSSKERLSIWQKAQSRFEKTELREWSFQDCPVELKLGNLAGLPVIAYPGLHVEGSSVSLKLFKSAKEAEENTPPAFFQLMLHLFGKDLGWIQKDLNTELKRVQLELSPVLDSAKLKKHSMYLLCRYLFECEKVLPLSSKAYELVQKQFLNRKSGIVQQYVDCLVAITTKVSELRRTFPKEVSVESEVASLLNGSFLLSADYSNLKQFPRYLECLKLRYKRARSNPVKDGEKVKKLLPYLQKYSSFKGTKEQRKRLRWLIEEYKVQLFAQELGTSVKVSEKILDQEFLQVAES